MTPEERIEILESKLSLMNERFERLLTYVKQHTHQTTLAETTDYGRITFEGEDTSRPNGFFMEGVDYPEDI